MKKRTKKAWTMGRPTPGHLPTDESFERMLDEAEASGALNDPEVQRLFFALNHSPRDPHLLACLADALQPSAVLQRLHPDPFRPHPDAFSDLDAGDVYIGTVNETHIDWCIPRDRLPHVAVIGPTDGGKTSAVYGMLQDIDGTLPYLLITPKHDAGRLLVDPPIADRVIRFEELRISLFTPPRGVEARTWQLAVIELICLTWLLQYARSIAYDCVDELREEFEKLSLARGRSVMFTLRNLLERVRRKRSKYAEGLATVLDLIVRSTGPVFDCSEGWPVEDVLLKGSTILIVSDVKDDKVARFVVDWIMEYAHAWLRTKGPNDGTPQLLIGIDDAHRFLTARAEKDKMTTLAHSYLMVRQSGIRLLAVSHCPDDLSPAVISQSKILLVAGALTTEDQVRVVGRAFGLPPEDWNVFRGNGQGEFIAHEQLGRYSRPFAGTIKRFPQPTVPFTESDRVRLMRPVLRAYSWRPTVVPVPPSAAKPAQPMLSMNATALALDIFAHPWSFVSDRYQRQNLSAGAGTKAKEELVDGGWTRAHALPRHGGKPVLLEPLTPLATDIGRPLPKYGKGGFLHAALQHIVAATLKQRGYTGIELEKFYCAKGVDLVGVSPAGDLEAWEITISTGNVVDNFEKDFLAQPRFARITAVCLSAKDADRVRKTLHADRRLATWRGRMDAEAIAKWL